MQRLLPQHWPFSVHDTALGRQQRQLVVASHTEPAPAWQHESLSFIPSRRHSRPSPAHGRQKLPPDGSVSQADEPPQGQLLSEVHARRHMPRDSPGYITHVVPRSQRAQRLGLLSVKFPSHPWPSAAGNTHKPGLPPWMLLTGAPQLPAPVRGSHVMPCGH